MSRNITPLSFKTVPGRNPTQKWNKAPTYSYEGDEWGGYDDYPEYDEPPPPLPIAQNQAAPPPAQLRGRVHSFDRGDETRQFSSSSATTAFPAYEEQSTETATRGYPRGASAPRDFTNPEQAPAPLATRSAGVAPTPSEWFPPRKSSLSGTTYENAAASAEARAIAANTSPTLSSSPNTDKPLPFIRPSDIYKRIPAELRRQSEDGPRPSIDSLQRTTSPSHPILTPVAEARESRLFAESDVAEVQEQANSARAQPTLDTSARELPIPPPLQIGSPVDRSRNLSPATRSQLPSFQANSGIAPSSRDTSPTLPQVQRFSGFGDDFLSKGSAIATAAPAPTADDLADASASGNAGTDLQHQPSQGFRSAVHKAFDRSDNTTPLSGDDSQSGTGSSGVSRSDTNSTTGISPIMSRVPSAATAAFRQQRVEGQVPTIAEESPIIPAGVRPGSGPQGVHRIARKPSPSHGRNGSAETAIPSDFEPGYRRSLDPPSTGTSPARTPDLQTTDADRLSSPMSAVPMTKPEAPDVVDQGAEVPEPALEPAETPASELSTVEDLLPAGATKPLPIATRGRSGTDYSVREADIADTVNASPDKGVIVPAIAQAQKDSQRQFLEMHGTPTSPMSPAIWEPNRSQSGTPTHGSRAGSPAKGRVREIADKFQEIHNASRRNSNASGVSTKSSWSQFDKPTLSRKGTSQSQVDSESAAVEEPVRPELAREESFKPELPGGWISSAPTPSIESPTREIPSPETSTANEPVDLMPTTRKYPLQAVPISSQPSSAVSESRPNPFDAVKNVGDQLGASLLSTVGLGHQTRDFASAKPAPAVDQPEMAPKAQTGEVNMQPPLMRFQSDSTDAPTSVASSVAPTPPAKDVARPGFLGVEGGAGGYFNTVAPLRVRSREGSPEHTMSEQRLQMLPLSTDPGSGDMDNDRLRKEIVRSLDPSAPDDTPRVSIDDTERLQGAIDAPLNERKVEHHGQPPPAAETSARPTFVNTRFSWEDKPANQHGPKIAEPIPEPVSPEIKPEAAFERPRSSVLHVVNTNVSIESPADDPVPILQEPVPTGGTTMNSLTVGGASADTGNAASPIMKNQEHLLPEANFRSDSPSLSLTDIPPSPMSDQLGSANTSSTRLPSYYLGDNPPHIPDVPDAPEKDPSNTSTMSQPVSPSQTRPAGPIQPFRNILALKTSDERIRTYNETRQTFAGMDTGLTEWLSKMLEYHPEHAGLSVSNSGFKPPALQTQGSTFRRGHRPSPSLAKFTNKFTSNDGQRTASTGSTEGDAAARPTPGGSGMDMDRMRKDFMKSAGVLGGKASSGAKGLFAKGKNRFASGSIRGKPNSNYEASATVPTSALVATPAVATHEAPSTLNERQHALEMFAVLDVRPPPMNEAVTVFTVRQTPEPVFMPTLDMSILHAAANLNPINSPTPIATPITAIPAPPASDPPSISATIATPSPKPSSVPLHRRQSSTGSPFRRANSKTPSTSRASSGRPLSQVFERLRDKTRSVSRSSTRSERREMPSRPTSLVLTNTDSLMETPDAEAASFNVLSVKSTQRGVDSYDARRDRESPRPSHMRSSTAPSITPRRAMSMAMPIRTEAWNEPDAQLPTPKTPEDRSRVGRIGILPSPAPTIVSFPDGAFGGGRRASQEVAKRRISNAYPGPPAPAVGVQFKEEVFGEELGTVPSADEGANEEDAPKTKAEKPKPLIRRGSDLATLPSVAASASASLPTTAGAERKHEHEGAREEVNPSEVRRENSAKTSPITRRGATRQLSRGSSSGKVSPIERRRRSRGISGASAFEELALYSHVPVSEDTGGRVSPMEEQPQSKQAFGPPIADVEAAAAMEERKRSVSPIEERRPAQGRYFIANATTKDDQVDDPSPPGEVPAAPVHKHERKMSDLALLPSQRQQLASSSARPESQILVPLTMPSNGDVAADEELYEASPVTIKQVSPRDAKHDGDDDLYDTTPIDKPTMKSAAPWGEDSVGSTGHETEIEQMEREIAEAAAIARGDIPQSSSEALPSRPTTYYDDTKSEVSAEEGAAVETRHYGASTRASSTKPQTSSRRSSVSSLGAMGDAEKDMLAPGTAEPTLMNDEARQLVMSAHAIPAGPIGPTPSQQPPSHIAVPQVPLKENVPPTPQLREQTQSDRQGAVHQEQFANRRLSNRRPQTLDRPLSYNLLPRDAHGRVQEQISTAQEHQPVPMESFGGIMDAGRMNVLPAGGQSFQPQLLPGQRPAHTQPTEYERLRSSVANASGVSADPVPHTDLDLLDAAGRPPASFFRGSRSGGDAGSGLQDGRDFGPGAQESEYPALQNTVSRSQKDDVSSRRGSGLWQSFSRRSSRSAAKLTSSRDSSLAPLDSRNISALASSRPGPERFAREDAAKRNTLRKPQRASSDAVELEPKKKRFSKLGSLFGRSNTTAQAEPAKTVINRLSKKMPTDSPSTTRRADTAKAKDPQLSNVNTVAGGVRTYEAYEAKRRRDIAASQQQHIAQGGTAPAPSQQQQQQPRSPTQEQVSPPPGGWYAPSTEQDQRPISPTTTTAPLPGFRRLPSSSQRTSRPATQVPEAFKPVQASFHQTVEPIGPPPGHEPPFTVSSPEQLAFAQGRRPPFQDIPATERMVDPRQQRQMSYASDVSEMSRQESGQAAQHGTTHRSASVTAVSPVEQPTRHGRHGSVDQKASQRSAPQSPWAVLTGRKQERARGSRAVSMSAAPQSSPSPQQQQQHQHAYALPRPPVIYGNPPPGVMYPQPYQMPPQQQGPPAGQGYPYPPISPGYHTALPLAQPQSRPPVPWEDVQPMRHPQPQQQYMNPVGAYASPPYSPQSPHSPPPRQQGMPYGYPPEQMLPPQPQYGVQGQQYYPAPPSASSPPPAAQQQQHVYYQQQQQQPHYHEARQDSQPKPRYYPQQTMGENTAPSPLQQQPPPPAPQTFYDDSMTPTTTMMTMTSRRASQQYKDLPHIPEQHGGDMGRPRSSGRRRLSSYTGRRDDPTVNEEDLIMRGVSYPGQEWAPSGLGNGGWD